MNELVTPKPVRLSKKHFKGRRVTVAELAERRIVISEVDITRSRRVPYNDLLLMQVVADGETLFCWTEAALLVATVRKALEKGIQPPYSTRIKQNRAELYMFVK